MVGEHIKIALRDRVRPLMSCLLYHIRFRAHAEKDCMIRGQPLLLSWFLETSNTPVKAFKIA